MRRSTPGKVGVPKLANPARRRFVARLSKVATAAVPLAIVSSVGLPRVQAGY